MTLSTALRYWAPLVVYCAAIFAASALPAGRMAFDLFPHADKLIHAAEYGILGVLALRAAGPGLPGMLLRSEAVLVAVLFSLAYGALDEVHQSYVPGRAMDFVDLVADVTGAGIAASAYGRLRVPALA